MSIKDVGHREERDQGEAFEPCCPCLLCLHSRCPLLTQLHDPTHVQVYVQDLMQEDAQRLAQLILHEGAYVMVCGDGAGMAKDVHATLKVRRLAAVPAAGALGLTRACWPCPQAVLAQWGGLSDAEAALRLTQLAQTERRYIRDIWS